MQNKFREGERIVEMEVRIKTSEIMLNKLRFTDDVTLGQEKVYKLI